MPPSPRLRKRKEVAKAHTDNEDPKKSLNPIEYEGKYDNLVAVLLFLVAIPVRLRNLSLPAEVVFDEVHFGKHASYYINGFYFFDIHPPLSKLLIFLVAWISGFDGYFRFELIGDKYPSNVPYTQMRSLSALFGAFVIPIIYLTLRDNRHSHLAAILAAVAVCFENGYITNNRLILLDSFLVFFTALTIFAYGRFSLQKSFTGNWWAWLCMTGVGLGCTVSTKWVGLFTIATIGLSTTKQLWNILGDMQLTKRHLARHFFARVFGLIIIPVSIYIGAYYIHFSVLNQFGPGALYMSVETQSELNELPLVDTPVPVTYGSLITIRHLETAGSHLHSHKLYYPDGSQQQQVTLYPFKDDNNWWKIKKAEEKPDAPVYHDILANDNVTWLEYVREGDTIVLEHVSTSPKKLHSHDIPAPVTDTDYHKEVSCYGFPDYEGDFNDFWKVQISPQSKHREAGKRLEARRSQFRLFHMNMACHLFSTFERLPEWGHNQQEVSCIQDGLKPKTMWIVDEVKNPLLPNDTEREPERRPQFWEKLIHLHKMIVFTNNELTEPHPFESRPLEWLVLNSGIRFWSGKTRQIILLGNPIVLWSSTVAILSFLMITTFFKLRQKRGWVSPFGTLGTYYENSASFFAVGWLLHYVPFFYMKRQLFSHHYMPALYFAILTLGVGVDLILRRFPPIIKVAFIALFCTGIVQMYLVFSPITYGEPWSVDSCESATYLKTWDFDCSRYSSLESPEEAELYSAPVPLIEDIPIPELDIPNAENPAVFIAKNPTKKDSQIDVEEDDNNDNIVDDVPATKTSVKNIKKHVPGQCSINRYISKMMTIAEEKTMGRYTDYDSDDSDDEESDDDEDDERDGDYDIRHEPTEAPEPIIYEPPYVDGTELVADDDDEEDWPKTMFGIDPDSEDEENPSLAVLKDIPTTQSV
ncbi:Dolichyl-phosphate-mannose-protein mannosyltransferase-domain-containing protein [Pilobolus umbonatus]|nr:Dolichyl-phosphate-mannose-protein mannosyltransferase-domain-containing protein [Pilobolus umbonatus]